MRNKGNGKNQRTNGTADINREEFGEEGSADDDLGLNKEEEYVYYMLAPPWARHRDPILYLQQF